MSKITAKLINAVAVITIYGPFDYSDDPSQDVIARLRATVLDYLGRGSEGILLVLQNLAHSDSAFIGELMSTLKLCNERGIPFGLVKPSKQFAEHLVRFDLYKKIDVYEDIDRTIEQWTGTVVFHPRGYYRDTDPDGHVNRNG